MHYAPTFTPMIYRQSQQYLESFINHEIHLDQTKSSAFKLERVEQLLKNLGDPQSDLKIIHVAGSKGKGSICALTANILKESGYRVGLYTSPHVNNYRERIRVLASSSIDRKPTSKPTPGVGLEVGLRSELTDMHSNIFTDMISEEELSGILEKTKPAIEQTRIDAGRGRLSFFEVTTALALYYFREQKVDFVILETGLGGRLDATNVVHSMIAVIAPISLEHTKILGNTISDIAKEKSAIIKNGNQKVIIASQEESAQKVLKDRCSRFHIEPVWVEEEVKSVLCSQDIHGQMIDLSTKKANYEKLLLPLLGAHQRDNCAVAVSIVECLQDLGYAIAPKAIEEGIQNIFWPLRFEVASKEPLIILDGAHNEASIKMLADLTKEIFSDKPITVVFGISKDKDKKAIFNQLKMIAGNIIFTKANHPRAENLPGAVSVPQALDLARQASGKNNVILVTGSLFVASEARAAIGEMKKGAQCAGAPASH